MQIVHSLGVNGPGGGIVQGQNVFAANRSRGESSRWQIVYMERNVQGRTVKKSVSHPH